MLDMRALEYSAKPRTLRFRIAGKVEHDGNAFRQEGANVRREGVPQPRRAVHESGYISDLARKELVQELVLYEANGIVALGEISRERRFPGRHLAAQEYQLR